MTKRKLKQLCGKILDEQFDYPQFKVLIGKADSDYMRKRAIEAIETGHVDFAISLLLASEYLESNDAATLEAKS